MKISKAERAALSKEIQQGFVQVWTQNASAKKKLRDLQHPERGTETSNRLLPTWKLWAFKRNWLS